MLQVRFERRTPIGVQQVLELKAGKIQLGGQGFFFGQGITQTVALPLGWG